MYSDQLTRDAVFDRIVVDHLVRGVTRVSWRLFYQFNEPGPYLFHLEVATTGAPDANDWAAITVPTANIGEAYDPVRRLTGLNPITHYRVVLETGLNVHQSQPQSVLGCLDKHSWLNAVEVVRGFKLYQKVRRTVSGVLYKRMRVGPPQPLPDSADPRNQIVNPYTGGIMRRQGDHATIGTGILGGFFTPYPLSIAFEPGASFEDIDASLTTGNTDLARMARTGRALNVPPLASRDVFVAEGSDLRFEIGKIQTVAAVGDVSLIADLELRQITFNDIIYDLPAARIAEKGLS